jgi:hypothetical protein
LFEKGDNDNQNSKTCDQEKAGAKAGTVGTTVQFSAKIVMQM